MSTRIELDKDHKVTMMRLMVWLVHPPISGRVSHMNVFVCCRATTNNKVKETVALELSFVNSNLQLLKEELEELNSSMEVYQTER